MNEKPLERLHFFNGQRLQAEDFRLEQDYHMRVRRWLNRSLYTSGIASGLEVRKVPGSPSVIVGPGLALDHFGREIILLDEHPVPLQGRGIHYLTIRYQEDTTAHQNACCPPASSSKNHTASGGPSRILAEPLLEWSTGLPHEESGRVLLARVELSAGCKDVKVLDTSVRRYVGAASAAKVRQYALEGVRELDQSNPATIIFHVRGRNPTSITLYLRSEPFPTYFYSEMGRHTHNIHVSMSKLHIPAHQHSMPKAETDAGTSHSHGVDSITADADSSIWHGVLGSAVGISTACTLAPNPIGAAGALAATELALWAADAFDQGNGMNLTLSPRPFRDKNADDIQARVNMSIGIGSESTHTHGIPSQTVLFPATGVDQEFGLSVSSSTADPAGVVGNSTRSYAAHDGVAPLGFIDNLQISIGPSGHAIPKTADILRQLSDSNPTDWRGKIKLGDGGTTLTTIDVLQENGTGAIRLDFLSDMSFGEGEYVIELSVPAGPKDQPNGGRIHYNLYIE